MIQSTWLDKRLPETAACRISFPRERTASPVLFSGLFGFAGFQGIVFYARGALRGLRLLWASWMTATPALAQ